MIRHVFILAPSILILSHAVSLKVVYSPCIRKPLSITERSTLSTYVFKTVFAVACGHYQYMKWNVQNTLHCSVWTNSLRYPRVHGQPVVISPPPLPCYIMSISITEHRGSFWGSRRWRPAVYLKISGGGVNFKNRTQAITNKVPAVMPVVFTSCMCVYVYVYI